MFGHRPPAPFGWGSLTVRSRPLTALVARRCDARDLLVPATAAASSRLSSGRGALPGAPGLELARVGLERARPRPGTPSIGWIPSLATRAGEFEASTFSRRFAHLAPVRVLRCSSPSSWIELPPHTTPRVVRHASRPTTLDVEKMRLTDFCNCTISRHEHLLERFDSRGDGLRYSRLPSRPLEPKPHRTARVAAPFDVALPASVRSTTPPSSSDEGAGTGCSWWDP
jgi:hypothetical protein